MKLRFAILWLLSAAAFAQRTDPIPLVGTVETILGNEIRLRAGSQSLAIQADSRTEVWKRKRYRDLSPLKPGSVISVRCEKNSAGQMVALDIRADAVAFTAVIDRINPEGLLVSSPRLGNRVVRFYPTTVFRSGVQGPRRGTTTPHYRPRGGRRIDRRRPGGDLQHGRAGAPVARLGPGCLRRDTTGDEPRLRTL